MSKHIFSQHGTESDQECTTNMASSTTARTGIGQRAVKEGLVVAPTGQLPRRADPTGELLKIVRVERDVDLDVDRGLASIHGPHQTLLVLGTVQQLGVHRTRFTEWDGA